MLWKMCLRFISAILMFLTFLTQSVMMNIGIKKDYKTNFLSFVYISLNKPVY
jgi:hypothetical protein